ncbi:MAG TPA: DNA polymerase III subunit delta [bacterium]|nr:DNA polymerase III subunit delta [bacterium]
MTEPLPCVFLFLGDPFLTEEKIKSCLESLEKKTKLEIPCVTYDLSVTSLENILMQARVLPFLAQAQAFRIKNADSLKKSDQEAIGSYLKEPSGSTFLFFESETIEKANPLVKIIQKRGEVHFLGDQEKKAAGRRFIQLRLKQYGKSMPPQAIDRLLEEAGDHPMLLDSMLERLFHYAGEKSQMTEEMVDTFREDFQSANVFELTDAIAQKQTGRALRLLAKSLEDHDKDWVGLLGLLHWQIRRLWQAKILREKGLSESEIARRLKINPRQSSFVMRQLERFDRSQLEESLEELFQMDWKIKTGRSEALPGLEAWVVRTSTS